MKPQQLRLLRLLSRALGKFTEQGPERNFKCPFCEERGSDHIGTLHVNIYKNAALCHSCWFATRNLWNIVRDKLGFLPILKKDEQELIKISRDKKKFLREIRKLLWPKEEKAEIVGLPTDFIRLTLPPSSLCDKLFYRYLRYRGLTDEQIDDYGIGYCVEGRYAGYLVFPFYQRGFPVYFTSRVLFGSPVKSLNPAVGRKYYLYNLDRASRFRRIVMVEGVFDAIAVGEMAVAILGSKIHKEQIRLLGRIDGLEEVCVMLDADAHEETIDLAARISNALGVDTSYVLLREGDPADNRHRINKLLGKRKELTLGKVIRMRLDRDTTRRNWIKNA